MTTLWKIMAALLVAIYPLAIYFGIQHFEPKFLALGLLGILILRLLVANQTTDTIYKGKAKYLIFSLGIVLIGLSLYFNSLTALKLYPVIVSLSLLLLFAGSLYFPPSIIERFARLHQPDLPDEAIDYTIKVTKIWCVFFVINGLIALYTAMFSSTEIWTLYNGLLSYVIMGVIFLSEFIYRKIYIQKD